MQAALALAALAHVAAAAPVGCPWETTSMFPGGWPRVLDGGIYWFGPGDQAEKAGNWSQFYNASRDTVIYFHGWLGSVGKPREGCYRPTSSCDTSLCGKSIPMANTWLQQGWNVGFFYWDQFADEACARDAEQKIWFDRGSKGLRWASYGVDDQKEYHTFDGGDIGVTSIADLCVRSVDAVMGNFSGRQLRFVGHSLGAQLAAHCASKLQSAVHTARPTRLTLLDPIFTERHLRLLRCSSISLEAGVGDFAASATANAVQILRRQGVPTELYKSSAYSESNLIANTNEALDAITLLVEYEPAWCDDMYQKWLHLKMNWHCRHKAAVPLYFWSLGSSPSTIEGDEIGALALPGSCLVPSAACTDGQLLQMLRIQQQAIGSSGRQKWWQQVGGRGTMSVSDDTFEAKTKDADATGSGAAVSIGGPSGGTAGGAARGGSAPPGMPRGDPVTFSNEVAGGTKTVAAGRRLSPGTLALAVLLGLFGTALLAYGLQPVLMACCRRRSLSAQYQSTDDESDGGELRSSRELPLCQRPGRHEVEPFRINGIGPMARLDSMEGHRA